jgi:hypothetical protein
MKAQIKQLNKYVHFNIVKDGNKNVLKEEEKTNVQKVGNVNNQMCIKIVIDDNLFFIIK